jgi:photosystem II stability/assembly factor-like uncharacterized protein
MRRLALVLLLLAGCGGSAAAPEAPLVVDAEREHVHGLALEPGGRLLIATHGGLFAHEPGAERAERVGTSRQDLMGFTVAGDRWLASGHPALEDSGPPNLGLIESRDRGASWTPVSLRGEADFHVLEADGDRIMGFDATGGGLRASEDGGRTWEDRDAPGAVFDLVLDGERVVASTERGIATSDDAGRTWRPRNDALAGLLARDGDALVLVDGRGQVLRSTDGGRRFQAVGAVGAVPVALHAADGTLVAADETGAVHESEDGGSSWRVRLPAGA